MRRLLFFLPVLLIAATDPRIERVGAVCESNCDLVALEIRAKKSNEFKKAEALWEQALGKIQSNTKEFIELAIQASKQYHIAAKDGAYLGAFYSQLITNDFFYQTSLDIEMGRENGELLAKANYCAGYLYAANTYELTKEWQKLKQTAQKGVKSCNEELVSSWMIDRLRVLEATANVRLKK